MRSQGHLCRAVLSCLLWLAVPGLLRSEFKLAYVTEHSLYTCTCMQDLVACGVINSSECDCRDHALSALRRAHGGASMVHMKRLTVWYTSPLHVALLLNNSEVRHLTLIKCNAAGGGKPAPVDHFTVQRLERLTVSYPLWRPGQTHDVVLGRDMGAPYHEEARIAIVHTSVLVGKAGLKAYTVETSVGSNGLLPFPNLFMSQDFLPETSSIFVTFLY